MHLILLSGGSGKRLWPLSNDVKSKQFLKLLKAPDGSLESMVQRVYRQIGEAGLADGNSITVTAGEIQLEQIRMQLGKDVHVVLEPARRDTFLAIALAVSYLCDVCNVDRDETVIVAPVDSFVDTAYFERFRQIDREVSETDAEIVLLGSKPVKSSEKYGYIVPVAQDGNIGGRSSEGRPVARFREKPTLSEAAELIKEGALWNCGVFGFRLGYLLNVIEHNLGIGRDRYRTLLGAFIDLRRRSFDYEVVEHARDVRVIEYAGAWKDLGTWETFTEEIEEKTMGNVWLDEYSYNTHVLNELDTPVVVMRMSNAVVVSNHEGILVAPKGESYRLKDAVAHLKSRPMQEEKRWGMYVVLDHSQYENFESLTKKLTIHRGSQISYQSHAHRKEIWTVVSGKGTLYLNGDKRTVQPGDTVVIEPGDKHAIHADSKLEIVEVQLGDKLVEDDIVRYEMDW